MRTALILAALAATWTMATAETLTQTRTVPVGATLDVMLQAALNSGSAKIDQRFEGPTVQDLTIAGQVVVPSGATVRGFVSSIKPSSKLDHQGQLTLSFDELRIGEQTFRLRASVSAVIDPRQPGAAARAEAPPVVGGTVNRGPVAFVGVLIGPGGTMLSTNGSDVSLPVGVVIRVRLDRPLEMSGIK